MVRVLPCFIASHLSFRSALSRRARSLREASFNGALMRRALRLLEILYLNPESSKLFVGGHRTLMQIKYLVSLLFCVILIQKFSEKENAYFYLLKSKNCENNIE